MDMRNLGKVVPRFDALYSHIWHSLEIFGDVQKSLGLLQHHSKCQVFLSKPKKSRDGNHTHLTYEKLAGLEGEDQRIKNNY